MMKFLFSGHLFKLFQNFITVVTPYGDKYKIDLTGNPENPFRIRLISKFTYQNDEYEQITFEKELKREAFLGD